MRRLEFQINTLINLTLVFLLGSLGILSLPGVALAEDSLDALLRQVATTAHGHATFIEQQHLAVFIAPNHLEKKTVRPTFENLVVDNDMLTITRGRQVHSVSLQAYPQLAIFINSMRATLAGDRATLESAYETELSFRQTAWLLTLSPRDKKLAKVIKKIQLSGEYGLLKRVEMMRADGDWSVMDITPSFVL
jgi:hypothetical protein